MWMCSGRSSPCRSSRNRSRGIGSAAHERVAGWVGQSRRRWGQLLLPVRSGRRTRAGRGGSLRSRGADRDRDAGGGHADEGIERVVLSGLRPGTTYHYRLVVSNATGTSYGPDETFTTAAATPPAVATGAAVEVGATAATLTGTVGPRGLPTSYVFEVGTDAGYGGAKLFGNAGEGTGEEQVSVALRFLTPGTTYHYRLVASSFDGTTYGQDETFTTPEVSPAVAQPPGTPLLASPTEAFPLVAGAVTGPVSAAKPRKAPTGAQKLEAALRACRRAARQAAGRL